MRTVEIKVYTFDELSPKSKAKAIERQRERNGDDEGRTQSVTDHMYEILQKHGWVKEVPWGSQDDSVKVNWSLSCCQGDGACFYCAGKSWFSSTELERVVNQAVADGEMDKKRGRQLNMLIEHHGFSFRLEHVGSYYHSNSIRADVEYDIDDDWLEQSAELPRKRVEAEALADSLGEELLLLARIHCGEMEKEGQDMLDAYYSEESVIEDIKANEDEFRIDGSIFHG